MKKILIFAIFLLLFTSCSKEEEQAIKKTYNTTIVSTWVLNSKESYIWYTESFNTVMLSPKIWWKIINIYKKEWDRVSIWELVASVDWSEAKVWYNSTKNIISSLEELKKSTSEMFDEQIKAMEYKIEQAIVWVSWSKEWLSDVTNIWDEQLKTVEKQIKQVKSSLEHTQNILNSKEKDLYTNWKNAIASSMVIDTNIITFSDELLWITDSNRNKNDSFESYLWAKNSSLKNEAEEKFRSIYTKFLNYKSNYETKILIENPSFKDIKKVLEEWKAFNENLRIFLKTLYDMIDASVESTSFPKTAINNYKNSISTFQNQVEQVLLTVSWDYILWLKWSLDNIENFEKESALQLDALNKQLDTLNQTYEQYKAMTKWQITDVKTKSEIAEKSLEEARAWLESLKKQKETKLNEINAKIKEAIANQSTAWVMIENSKVYSPISWIVISKNAEVWQVIWGWMPILIVATNDKIKVNINISDELKQKINTWDEVIVEIEWISWQLNWKITKILPTRDPITKKTWVEITLDNKDKKIQIWSYTKVYFPDEKDKWIIIPNSAIISKFMIPWVYVIENGEKDDNKKIAVFKNIEIIKQNDNFSMIKWLNVWETVITEGKENISDGEEL